MMSNIQERPNDKFLPLGFVGFFLVIFIVNGVMVYLALTTRTGMVAEHHYERGLHYNDYLAEAQAQTERGWKSTLTYADGKLTASLTDKAGKQLQQARVRVEFMRPTQAGFDFTVDLAPGANGIYMGEVKFSHPGLWTATLVASWNQQNYRQTQDLFVQP
jgi:nitrogen fixation protein FixH